MKLSVDRPAKRMRVSAKKSLASPEAIEASTETGESSGTASEEDSDDDRQAMLDALEAYNRSMLGFGASTSKSGSSTGKGKERAVLGEDEDSEAEDEEFHGENGVLSGLASGSEDSDEDEESGELYDEDEEFVGIAHLEVVTDEIIPTVVYDDTAAHLHPKVSKADYKRFMSSKSAKILASDNQALALDGKKRKAQEEGDDEEQSNISLDKSLHSLLMTSLLPNAHEASRPVDKRNQMSSRLLELANISSLGEGQAKLAETTHKGHAARMRSAIEKAKVDRSEKARAQAQAAGSWVKGVGGLGDSGSGARGKTLAQQKRGDKSLARKDRDRGLAMGIGKFKGGMLTLNEREIARGSAAGPSRPDRGGKGKGGGRGKGKRRD